MLDMECISTRDKISHEQSPSQQEACCLWGESCALGEIDSGRIGEDNRDRWELGGAASKVTFLCSQGFHKQEPVLTTTRPILP